MLSIGHPSDCADGRKGHGPKNERLRSVCRAALITEENGKTYITDNYIRYVDTLVKEEGTWKISIRDQYFVIVEKREMKA